MSLFVVLYQVKYIEDPSAAADVSCCNFLLVHLVWDNCWGCCARQLHKIFN